MAYHIRKKLSTRKHKNKTYKYIYYELIKTYRDPNNKKRVVSDFVAYLGKAAQVKANLERFKSEAQGQYSFPRLTKKLEKEVEKLTE